MTRSHQDTKVSKSLKRYKRRLERLRKLVGRNARIFKSNTVDTYQNLCAGEFLFRVNEGALQVLAKDASGRNDYFGFVPLYYANTLSVSQPLRASNSLAQVWTNAPYKFIYINSLSSWYPTSAMAQNFYDIIDAGFNIINLAFMVDGQPFDVAVAWIREFSEINPASGQTYRQDILNYAHARGCSIMISSGGATESNFFSTSPDVYARNLTDYVTAYGLDGVDLDLENFSPGLIAPGSTSSQETINWLVAVTNNIRSTLGNNALISFAPQQPYFSALNAINSWTGPLGGFTSVYLAAPSINFFNVQAYNQGDTNYVNYNNIFVDSGTSFPASAFTQISPWIPLNKLVLGKPMRINIDASTGYNTPEEINSILLQAKNHLGYVGNLFTWQWCYNEANPRAYAKDWLDRVTAGLY